MRYAADHKSTRRAELLSATAALAKQQGFAGTGLDALAAAAGATTGAFYSHFGSRAGLLQALVTEEATRSLQSFDQLDTPQSLFKAMRRYLSPQHVAHPESGCPVPALAAEIARADTATREPFEAAMLTLHQRFSAVLHDEDLAWALMCQAFGGILLARALATPEARDQLLQSLSSMAESQLLHAHIDPRDT